MLPTDLVTTQQDQGLSFIVEKKIKCHNLFSHWAVSHAAWLSHSYFPDYNALPNQGEHTTGQCEQWIMVPCTSKRQRIKVA